MEQGATLRVGRMPSNWGMGLLANGGDGFDDDFGENHFGSTNDRILVATKPLSLAKTILGKEDTDHPLTIAYAYDKISTTPLDVAGDEDPHRAQIVPVLLDLADTFLDDLVVRVGGRDEENAVLTQRRDRPHDVVRLHRHVLNSRAAVELAPRGGPPPPFPSPAARKHRRRN